MVTQIVRQATSKDITSRAERGRDLYLTKRQLITKVGEDAYTVPSSDPGSRYTVEYGADRETCQCTDYQVHRGEVSCKHLIAVALLFAKKRRTKTRTCAGCSGRFRGRDLVEVQDSLTYFEGDELCRSCWHGSADDIL